MKSRILLFAVLLAVVWVLVLLRGFQLQVLPHEKLQALKEKRFQRTVHIDARRGDLLDRSGKELAVSVPRYSLFVDPEIVKEPNQIISKLAKHLGQSKSRISAKVRRKNTRFVWIARRLSRKDYLEIKSWGHRGLAFKEEPQRIYPNGTLMSSLLGFVGAENRGLEGLELQLEEYLSGDKKVMVLQRDARGRPLIESGWMFLKNEDGKDVRLTLDRDLQFVVEQELKSVLQTHEAASASAIVVDVDSAEVVALANVPTFDPEQALKVPSKLRRNSAVVDSFEPGSTMKTFLVAAALQEGIVQPNSLIDTGGGVLKLGRRRITESDQHHKHDQLTVAEVLSLSSNVGSARLAFQLGEERYHRYLKSFGFGSKTGFSFPGEATGILNSLPWGKHLLASVGFGHGISASPLQVASAYTTLAFGGVQRPLKLVQAVRDPKNGQWKAKEAAVEPKRVLSQAVSDTVSLMLTMATSQGGTGWRARIPGFAVAGKTGTAQKVDPNGRGYLPGRYVSSFAGYFPMPNPKYVIVVSVDDPQKGYYGSEVAAPAFSKIASYLTRHEGLSPRWISSLNVVPRKEAAGWDYQDVQKKALADLLSKDSNSVTAANAIITVMPDLRGLSLREVFQRFRGGDQEVQFAGRGSKVKQSVPPAGEPLVRGQTVRVIF